MVNNTVLDTENFVQQVAIMLSVELLQIRKEIENKWRRSKVQKTRKWRKAQGMSVQEM